MISQGEEEQQKWETFKVPQEPNINLKEIIKNKQNINKFILPYMKTTQQQEKVVEILYQNMEDMKNIKWLDLNFNLPISSQYISGLIKGMEQLDNLEILQLSVSRLHNSEFSQLISKILGKNPNLIRLFLTIGYNDTEYHFLQSFGLSLRGYNNLKYLDLSINTQMYFKKEDFEVLTQSISSFSQLTFLKFAIGTNFIKEDGAQYIGLALQNLTNLEKLYLIIGTSNKIGKQGGISIGEGIKMLKLLKICDISIMSNNDLNSEGAKGIGEGLKELKNLQSFKIIIDQQNLLSSQGVVGLADGLNKLTNLQKLNIYIGQSNLIGYNGAKNLGLALLNLKKLIFLSIQIQHNNSITKQGLHFLSKGLQELVLLEQLKLCIDEFFIDQEEVQSIGQSLLFLKNMKELTMKIRFPYSRDGTLSIVKGFKSLIQLEKLNFDIEFPFEQGSIDTIGENLEQLHNLKDLSIKFYGELEDYQCKKLGQIFSKLPKLNQISFVFDQNFSVLGFEYFMSNLIFQNLKILDLDLKFQFNDLFKQLGQFLLKNNQIQKLQLNILQPIFDELNLESMVVLCQGLSSLNSLYFLKIYFEQIDSSDFQITKRLSQSICSLKNLQHLIVYASFEFVNKQSPQQEFINKIKKSNRLVQYLANLIIQ